jgi:hypothetical protein
MGSFGEAEYLENAVRHVGSIIDAGENLASIRNAKDQTVAGRR